MLIVNSALLNYRYPHALPFEEFDLSGVRTYPLDSRRSKARVEDFARPVTPGATFSDWFASLPAILAGTDVRRVVDAMRAARERRCGDRLGHRRARDQDRRLAGADRSDAAAAIVSALAMNGAGIIHDFEMALSGATSEDVDEALGPGRFGMAEETGRLLNEIIREASKAQLGLGQAVGAYLARERPPHAERSLAATCASSSAFR